MADSKLQRNPGSEGDRKKRSSVTLTVVVIALVVAAALAWFLVRNITTPPQLTAPSEQAVPVPSNNLDDSKSILTHLTITTHQRLIDACKIDLCITPGLIRLSVGLEDVDDLFRDILDALR